jgi:hypothetical protein
MIFTYVLTIYLSFLPFLSLSRLSPTFLEQFQHVSFLCFIYEYKTHSPSIILFLCPSSPTGPRKDPFYPPVLNFYIRGVG